MTWDEFWGEFDKRDYARSIQHLNKDQLRSEHARIRAKVVAAKSATAMSTAATLHTLGFSVVGMGIGARKATYNSQKLRIIEDRMYEEGWSFASMSTGDFLMAAGPAAAAGALGVGAEHLIGHVAGHGAAAFTGHHIADTVHAVEHNSSDFFHAAEHGAASQFHAVTHGVTGLGDATQLVPIDAVANSSPEFLGYVAGQGAANAAEIGALNYVFDKASEAGVRECVTAWRRGGEKSRRGSEESLYTMTGESSKDAKEVEWSDKKSQKQQRRQERKNSRKLSTATQNIKQADTGPSLLPRKLSTATGSHKQADTGPFLLPLLPPIIASVAGFTTLQCFTAGAVARRLYKTRSIREFDLTWKLVCFSVFYSSVFWQSGLLWMMFSIELWMFLAALRREIVTPKILTAVALSAWMIYLSGSGGPRRGGFFVFGVLSSASIMSVVQYNTGFGSGYVRSLGSLRWYHWRRPELLLVFSGLICLIFFLATYELMEDWMWLGVFLGTLFISCIQWRARREYF